MLFFSFCQGLTCCRTCRVRRGAVTPCLPAQTTASSSRQVVSTAASVRFTPSIWTRDGHPEIFYAAWMWQLTITHLCIYIYLRIILSALFLFWQEKKASGSLNGTKITRGWKTLVKLWICGQTNKWPKGKITERQYCARVLTHPTFLYISLAKWEIGNAICWNVQRYKAETVFADFWKAWKSISGMTLLFNFFK